MIISSYKVLSLKIYLLRPSTILQYSLNTLVYFLVAPLKAVMLSFLLKNGNI